MEGVLWDVRIFLWDSITVRNTSKYYSTILVLSASINVLPVYLYWQHILHQYPALRTLYLVQYCAVTGEIPTLV